MISKNRWGISGEITNSKRKEKGVCLYVKGKVYREDLYSQDIELKCSIPGKVWESSNKPVIGEKIRLSGLLKHCRNTYLLVDNIIQ